MQQRCNTMTVWRHFMQSNECVSWHQHLLMLVKPPKGSHLPCQRNSQSCQFGCQSHLTRKSLCFFTNHHKSRFQISAKTLSVPGYPSLPSWKQHQKYFRRRTGEGKTRGDSFLGGVFLNYHHRKNGNWSKFWSILDTSSRSASQEIYREIKVSSLLCILQSCSSMDKSCGHAGQTAYAAPGRADVCN